VYAYAQLGSGGSSRLSDPRGYGRARDVADLEAIRQQRLRAPRLVLVGHSYGSAVAAAYAAQYPAHVSRMMLISPPPLDPADTSPNLARSRLSLGQSLPVYRSALAPRPLLGYLLLQVNPVAAHAFMGDREADQRNDDILAQAEPALHCTSTAPRRTTSQSGFYALQYPQSAAAPRPPDLRPALRGVDVPTVIVKGSCDYLSWDSAMDYRRALPNSTLLYLSGAGHNAHQDRPMDVLRAARELLGGRPLSHAYDGPPPADFEGPK
jgi:proline iminopeptidase